KCSPLITNLHLLLVRPSRHMSRRTRIWIASLRLLAFACIAPVIYLRVCAIPACDASDRLWRFADARAEGDWSSIVRRATLDYLVAPIDGKHRLLVFQRARSSCRRVSRTS